MIAPFRFNVTPPLGHPLLGGLVMPAVAHDDCLEAIGYVLVGAGAPIVVCAVDWAGLMNEAHAAWRGALAHAAGTGIDRVAVQCVHQHNAPFVCPEAQAIAQKRPGLPAMFDPGFHAECLRRVDAAVREALGRLQPVTHLGTGAAPVHQVASNRRVYRDPRGQVIAMRQSACTDPVLRDLPEGTVDPMLRTIVFFSGERRIAACHFYATHPMSYYRDGRVTADFCGLARRRRQQEDPGCTHIYFTGCAGNVSAGKYNDGTPAARVALTERMYDGLVRSEAHLTVEPLSRVEWRSAEVLPGARESEAAVQSRDYRGDAAITEGLLAAFRESWRRRVERRVPLALSSLRLNDVSVLHLPGEMFVEYQLRARALRPGHTVAVAAYGDGGPWYVPTREEYGAGGYEATVAFCPESVDDQLTTAMQELLR